MVATAERSFHATYIKVYRRAPPLFRVWNPANAPAISVTHRRSQLLVRVLLEFAAVHIEHVLSQRFRRRKHLMARSYCASEVHQPLVCHQLPFFLEVFVAVPGDALAIRAHWHGCVQQQSHQQKGGISLAAPFRLRPIDPGRTTTRTSQDFPTPNAPGLSFHSWRTPGPKDGTKTLCWCRALTRERPTTRAAESSVGARTPRRVRAARRAEENPMPLRGRHQVA